MTDGYSGKILVRINPEVHGQAVQCAARLGISLNEFLATAIKEKVVQTMPMVGAFTRVVIEDLKWKECREAVILAQYPDFMRFVNRHRICFLRDNEYVSPMRYIFFYETESGAAGLTNEHPRQIVKWGRVKEILYDIHPNDYVHVDELVSLTQDTELWNEVQTWGPTKVVLFDAWGKLDEPLVLHNGLKARAINNKTIDLWRMFNAKRVDDLFKSNH